MTMPCIACRHEQDVNASLEHATERIYSVVNSIFFIAISAVDKNPRNKLWNAKSKLICQVEIVFGKVSHSLSFFSCTNESSDSTGSSCIRYAGYTDDGNDDADDHGHESPTNIN